MSPHQVEAVKDRLIGYILLDMHDPDGQTTGRLAAILDRTSAFLLRRRIEKLRKRFGAAIVDDLLATYERLYEDYLPPLDNDEANYHLPA